MSACALRIQEIQRSIRVGGKERGFRAFTERAVTTRTGSVADARPFLAV